MTEEEAKKKFCPLLCAAALVANLESGKGYGRCIGSKCMWWKPKPTYDSYTGQGGHCTFSERDER